MGELGEKVFEAEAQVWAILLIFPETRNALLLILLLCPQPW